MRTSRSQPEAHDDPADDAENCPTEDEIRERAEAVRRDRTPEERLRLERPRGYTVPLVRMPGVTTRKNGRK